ncbi:MAG: arsenic efflux protein [Clostridia bacterium]|nr:arsenic efflux protein [Clostridia bacterium]
MIIHSFLHAIEHTLPIIPFLYLTYLLMELLERKAGGKMQRIISDAGKFGPLLGALLGVVPQCGFSAVGAGLYAGRVITTGTLLAIFLSTSDEMLPLLISSGAPITLMLKILASKAVIAAIAGFAVDRITSIVRRGKKEEVRIVEMCSAGHCHCDRQSIWLASLVHTLKITASVFAVSFALEIVLELLGEDFLAGILTGTPVIGCLFAAIVGLLPNCASSVAITQLYLEGVISAGAMLSGLLVGAGIGSLVLLRANRPLKDSLRVIAILFGIGLAAGLVFDLISIGKIINI